MSKTALIVSLRYHPGHYSHLIAYYLLFNEIGYKSHLFLHKKMGELDADNSFHKIYNMSFFDYRRYQCVLFLFPSVRNIFEIIKLKLLGVSRVIYLYHEPISTYREFRESGHSSLYLIKLFIIDVINKLAILLSDDVILSSDRAREIYDRKNYRFINRNTLNIPLIFDDEICGDYVNTLKKSYISYIGTIAPDHGFEKFCDYVKYALTNKLLLDYKFLIATGSKLSEKSKRELKIIDGDNRLVIVEGNWLSNQEINRYYKESLLVWNAYDRSTQSGVLPKSFMHGTPVLGNSLLPNEFLLDGKNGLYLIDNSDLDEITNAIMSISINIGSYSEFCRQTFLNVFYYKSYVSQLNYYVTNE